MAAVKDHCRPPLSPPAADSPQHEGRGWAMLDIVQVHITSALPIRAHALPFADQIEVRRGPG